LNAARYMDRNTCRPGAEKHAMRAEDAGIGRG
jgi:hypothetical protein